MADREENQSPGACGDPIEGPADVSAGPAGDWQGYDLETLNTILDG
jgi:hypothetical protein